MKEIFPNVRFQTAIVNDGSKLSYHTKMFSYLRKQHTDGKWYLQPVLNYSTGDTRESIEWCVNDFMSNTYTALLFGKVLPDIKDSFGDTVFKLDEDQRSEEERLSIPKS
jgi:hypothetical protein